MLAKLEGWTIKMLVGRGSGSGSGSKVWIIDSGNSLDVVWGPKMDCLFVVIIILYSTLHESGTPVLIGVFGQSARGPWSLGRRRKRANLALGG